MATAMTFNERFLDNEQRIAANREDIDGLLDRIEWEQEDASWRMNEPSSPDLYDTAYINGLQETLTNAIEAVDDSKLDKNAGTENAGNYLAVSPTGEITPAEPLFTGIDETYLQIVNSLLGLNTLIPEKFTQLDASLADVFTALSGKLDKMYDTSRAGEVMTLSAAGEAAPAVNTPLWSNLQQKPFNTLKPEDFTVQGEQLSVNDRWTQGIQGVQANLNTETARLDGADAVQNQQIQQLQNGKLNIPFNIADGNIAVFTNTPAPAVADTGVKPADFVQWTQLQRVPVLWV
jgi:hypothetical protein